MKKLSFVALTAVVVLLTSCRSIQLAEFRPTGRNPKLLPYLEPAADIFSFRQVFPNTINYIPKITNQQIITDSSRVGFFSTTTEPQYSFVLNRSFYQTISYFEQDVKNNICSNLGKPNGTITCKIVGFNEYKTWAFLQIPSYLTLSLINLFGVPKYYLNSEIDLEVEIFDNQNNKIGRYTAYGKARVASAYYYGYNYLNIYEVARIRAFRMAMNDIKAQILNDYDYLNSKLVEYQY